MTRKVIASVLCFALCLTGMASPSPQTSAVVLESLDFDAQNGVLTVNHRAGNVLAIHSTNINAGRSRLDLHDGVVSGFIQVEVNPAGEDTLGINVGFGGKSSNAILTITRNSPPVIGIDPGFDLEGFVDVTRQLRESNLGDTVEALAQSAEQDAASFIGAVNKLCPGMGNANRPNLTMSQAFSCAQTQGLVVIGAIALFAGVMIKNASCFGQVGGCAIGPDDFLNCMNGTDKCD